MDWNGEDPTELWPWRCGCGRLNKKSAVKCAMCSASWTQGTRHRTEPCQAPTYSWNQQNWEEQEWEEWEEERSWTRSPSRHRQEQPAQAAPSPRARSRGRDASQQKGQQKGNQKGKKGSGKGKAKPVADMASPFIPESQGFAPWTSLDSAGYAPPTALPPSPFANLTAQASADKEWVEHLKKAYPDPATMPADTKALIEKAERDAGQRGIKNLYEATTHLKKSKKHLAEVSEHQKAHRAMWMSHVSTGLQQWETQLKQYKRHQAALTEQATKAKQEIAAASRMIQILGSTAAEGGATSTTAVPAAPPVAEPEDAGDNKEEEEMKTKMQIILRNCIGSLGLDLGSTDLGTMELSDEDEENNKDKQPQKRPRAAPLPSVSSADVDAYWSTCSWSGAASSCRDEFLQFLLPWKHSVVSDARYLNPFRAISKAFDLQWEVWNDLLLRYPYYGANARFRPASQKTFSQGPHPKTCRRHVQFEDRIEIFIGQDDDLVMHMVSATHESTAHWPAKPWSRKRIKIPILENAKGYQAPLSNEAVSSRFPYDPEHDHSIFMQTFKNTPYDDQQSTMLDAFTQGHADPVYTQPLGEASESPGASQYGSPAASSSDSGIHPPSSTDDRQDVIMFHLQDPPLCAYLDWSNYQSMIREIAYHFSTNVENVVDAYEINTPLKGIPPDSVPIIVHLFPDIAMGQQAKLVLFDIEYHGHAVEANFRLGPTTQRIVLAVPDWCDRNAILVVANIDFYCQREDGRCLMWHNGYNWYDHDSARRLMAHGDHIRIAIPPSNRFACATTDLVDWTQNGLSDDEILGHVVQHEVEDGYSPSLLDHDEVRELAVTIDPEVADSFNAMQLSVEAHQQYLPSQVHSSSAHGDGVKSPPKSPSACSQMAPDALWRAGPVQHSFTDEFIAFIDAANNVPEDGPEFPDEEPDLRTQSEFVQDLWEKWNDNAVMGPGHVERLAKIETWFTCHESFRRCMVPRSVVLARDYSQWERQLLAVWRDIAVPHAETSFYLVYPKPEDADSSACAQVVIVQFPDATMRSLVISIYDSSRDIQEPFSFCQVLTERVGIDDILETSGLVEVCSDRQPQNECSLWYGTTPIRHGQKVFVRSGYALRLSVRRGVLIEYQNLMRLTDSQLRQQLQSATHVEVYQRPQWPAFSGDVYGMNDPDFQSQPPAAIEDSPRESHPAAEDTLPSWIRALRRIFSEQARTEDQSEGAQVLLENGDGLVIESSGHEDVTMPSNAAHDSIPAESTDQPMVQEHSHEERDHHSLLQRNAVKLARKVSISLETTLPRPAPDHVGMLRVPCQHVYMLGCELLQLPLGTVHPFASVVKWHDTTLADREHCPDWIDETPVQFWLYTDGASRFSDTDQCRKAAASAVLMVETAVGWRFGGFHALTVPSPATAPLAEHCALLLAHVWCLQILEQLHACMGQHGVPVTFAFDCVAAGFAASGDWDCCAHNSVHRMTRSLSQWICSRYSCAVDYVHVKGHSGNAWNEAADAACWSCLHSWIHCDTFDSVFAHHLSASSRLCEWLWYLEHAWRGDIGFPCIVDGHFVFPLQVQGPQQQPDPSSHAVGSGDDADVPLQTLDTSCVLTCATANVLTLSSGATHGSNYISARQEALMTAFHERSVHFVGIQESRSRLSGHRDTDFYHVLAAPATRQGHCGVQLWVTKSIQIEKETLHIKAVHLRILSHDARHMIVRVAPPGLRLIVLVGHAPCDGGRSDAIDWWNKFGSNIPSSYSTWPRVCLIDANSRIGSLSSDAVGSHQAEDENEAGALMHQWLIDQSMFAPQTMSEFHEGPGATFVHSRGNEGRIDFVLVDQCLRHKDIRTSVSDIDLSLKKADHMPVIASIPVVVRMPVRQSSSTSMSSSAVHVAPPSHISWDTDVHTHAAMIHAWLRQCQPCRTKAPRKKHLGMGRNSGMDRPAVIRTYGTNRVS
eukprot:s641_g18.t1